MKLKKICRRRSRPARLRTGALSLIVFAVIAAAALWPRPAGAVLGEPAASVKADQSRMSGTTTSMPQPNYTVEQISTPWGTVVNEYVAPDGTVFAVSWRGPRPPDLSRMLGSYYSEYQTALAQTHQMRRQLRIETSKVVVQTGGHMRDLWGRAFVPSLMPSGVTSQEIK
jgi:hypothetical protein